MNLIFRTARTQARYDRHQKAGGLKKSCGLCKARALKTFVHWRIIANRFPYDRIARVHHMIVPKRHVNEEGLAAAELAELRIIKERYMHKKYEFIIEATYRMKSIPSHHHMHLILLKPIT